MGRLLFKTMIIRLEVLLPQFPLHLHFSIVDSKVSASSSQNRHGSQILHFIQFGEDMREDDSWCFFGRCSCLWTLASQLSSRKESIVNGGYHPCITILIQVTVMSFHFNVSKAWVTVLVGLKNRGWSHAWHFSCLRRRKKEFSRRSPWISKRLTSREEQSWEEASTWKIFLIRLISQTTKHQEQRQCCSSKSSSEASG